MSNLGKLASDSCSVPFSFSSHLCEIMVGKCSSSPFLLKTCVQLPWSVGSLKHHPPSPSGTLRINSGNQACVLSLVTLSASIENLWCLLLCLYLFCDTKTCLLSWSIYSWLCELKKKVALLYVNTFLFKKNKVSYFLPYLQNATLWKVQSPAMTFKSRLFFPQ